MLRVLCPVKSDRVARLYLLLEATYVSRRNRRHVWMLLPCCSTDSQPYPAQITAHLAYRRRRLVVPSAPLEQQLNKSTGAMTMHTDGKAESLVIPEQLNEAK